MRLALAALLVPALAAADPAPMAVGALPGPTETTNVTLVREELTIVVQKKDALVTAVLWLENDATPRTLPVGFPCEAGLDPGVVGLDCKAKITVKVDGKKVFVKQQKTSPEMKFWIWPMRFAAGQKVKVEVTYKAPLHNDRYETPVNGMGALHYRLRTGATWAGTIKELEMRVEMPSDAIVSIQPAGYTRQKNVVSWSLKDVEPTTDVALTTHPMYLGRARDKVAADWKIAETADELVRFAGWFHDVALKKLELPAPNEADVRKTIAESAALLAQ
jgi:hypothetical protein